MRTDVRERAHESYSEICETRDPAPGQGRLGAAAVCCRPDSQVAHLGGEYSIEVIDLLKNPKLARGDQIVAIPTLVRKLPPPLKRIIGDLSDAERVLVGLNLRPRPMNAI